MNTHRSIRHTSLNRSWPLHRPIRWLLRRFDRARVGARTFKMDTGPGMRYGISLRHPDDPPGPRPLVLCLHQGWNPSRPVPRGMGLRLLRDLFEPALRDLRAIIVAPDCPGRGWSDAVSERAVLSLVDHVRHDHNVAATHIVVVGLSDGATAAWSLVARHPDLFAAVIPVAGWPQLEWLDDRHARPAFAIHGRHDDVMPLAQTRAAIVMLRARGVPAELTVLEDAAHLDIRRFVEPLRTAVPWLQDLWTNNLSTGAKADSKRSSEEVGGLFQ